MSIANDIFSHVSSALRGGRGMLARTRKRSEEPGVLLEVYEFEA